MEGPGRSWRRCALRLFRLLLLKTLKSRTSNDTDSCAGPAQSYPVRGESVVLTVSELLSKNHATTPASTRTFTCQECTGSLTRLNPRKPIQKLPEWCCNAQRRQLRPGPSIIFFCKLLVVATALRLFRLYLRFYRSYLKIERMLCAILRSLRFKPKIVEIRALWRETYNTMV